MNAGGSGSSGPRGDGADKDEGRGNNGDNNGDSNGDNNGDGEGSGVPVIVTADTLEGAARLAPAALAARKAQLRVEHMRLRCADLEAQVR